MEYHEVRIVAELRKQGQAREGRGVPAQGHAPYAPSHPRAPVGLGWHSLRLPTLQVADRYADGAFIQAMTTDTERLRELAAGSWRHCRLAASPDDPR
jgi:hypothetical protein